MCFQAKIALYEQMDAILTFRQLLSLVFMQRLKLARCALEILFEECAEIPRIIEPGLVSYIVNSQVGIVFEKVLRPVQLNLLYQI